ncbi:type 1 glutamine amidotransferase [Geoalkalibacter halelectricus]|uniref:Type 1 glutamine amidotransferase n=1 Tax=Geoalkalibacter halelectricus TaxID=2847045 RepID=A0ABY5ZQR2_9BACT|nr:type 1 glutamine amidotransferase [Geoalkalibacter halelectricus]MDO3378660.1 type 1 glutamine amidotransferase [Geoalkalibacter halelectricus]UWZ80029.1 type 1 glutamine amidotransferase [Geoalkalibacter halelectricus]
MVLIVEIDPRCPAGLFGELLSSWGQVHQYWRAHDQASPPPLDQVRAAIVLGGAMGVGDVDAFPFLLDVKDFLRTALAAQLPFLGICLGGQLLAEALGAAVYSGRRGEHGCNTINLTAAGRRDPLFADLPTPFPTFHWHNDSFDIPAGAIHLASTSTCPGQAFRHGNAWGLQFHPEVDAAIVDDWRRRAGRDAAVVADFVRHSAALRRTGQDLLRRFLTLPFP